MPSDVVIAARGLTKVYELHRTPGQRVRQLLFSSAGRIDTFTALNDVSFEVRRGEFLGVIGQNGSGKSTLLQIVSGILTPTRGEVSVTGRVTALLELGAGFHPEFTGRENARFNAQILGLPDPEIDRLMPAIEAFADIGQFIDEPVKTYSSGMFVRLAFAVQASLEPDILIVDEALAVGDIFFRLKCYERLNQLRARGCTVVLVTHSMEDVLQYSTQALFLDGGRVAFLGSADEAVTRYYASSNKAMSGGPTPSVPISTVSGQGLSHATLPFPVPANLTMTDATGIAQVGDLAVRCSGFAICDDQGEMRRVFRQGQTLHVYARFVVQRDIETPTSGLVIRNDKGVIVHGRHGAQSDTPVPDRLSAGQVVLVHHRVRLALGLGEYVGNLGFATWPAQIYAARHAAPVAELEKRGTAPLLTARCLQFFGDRRERPWVCRPTLLRPSRSGFHGRAGRARQLNTMKPVETRETRADLCRSLALFGVVLIHACGALLQPWGPYALADWLRAANVLDSIARCSVPLFVMLSGALILQPGMAPIDLAQIGRRLIRVTVPLLLWSSIYLLYQAHQTSTPPRWSSLLSQPAMYHLWFVYMIIGLYALLPLLQGAFVHLLDKPGLQRYGLAIWFMVVSLPIYWTLPGLNLLHLNNLPGYGGYFVMGALLKHARPARPSGWVWLLAFVASVLVTAWLTQAFSSQAGQLDETAYQYFSPNIVLASMAAFILINRMTVPPIMAPTLARIADMAFPVFFVHPLILGALAGSSIIVGLAAQAPGSSVVLMLSIVTFAGSLAVAVVLRWLPFSGRLLG